MVHIRNFIVIYGGKANGTATSNRVFLLHHLESPMVWEEVTPRDNGPVGRWGHSALAVEKVPMSEPWWPVHRGTHNVQGVLFFGGMSDVGTALDDLLFFDPFSQRWTKLEVCGVPLMTCQGLSSSQGHLHGHPGLHGCSLPNCLGRCEVIGVVGV